MGSAAKIILVGAASLIVGIYAVALKNNQTNDMMTSWSYVKRVQTERTEDAAIRFALFRVEHNTDSVRSIPSNNSINIGATKTLLGGGTYTYSFLVPYGSYSVTGTVVVTPPNEASKTITLKMEKVFGSGVSDVGTKPGNRRFIRGQWQVTKYQVATIH